MVWKGEEKATRNRVQAGEWDDGFHVFDNVEKLGKGRNVFERNMNVITCFRLLMVKELRKAYHNILYVLLLSSTPD